MENTTKFHADLTKNLNELIIEFHKKHPDLFINEIEIISDSTMDGNKKFLGTKIEILVQPNN